MHKQLAKDVFRAAGLPVVKSIVADRRAASAQHLMEPPYVVKPVNEGSSVGVFIIRKGDNRPPAELGSETWTLSDAMMVEEYVPGRELTVAVMGGRALAVTEILPTTTFYDYEAKYAAGGSHACRAGEDSGVRHRTGDAVRGDGACGARLPRRHAHGFPL